MKRRNFLMALGSATSVLVAPPAFGQTLELIQNASQKLSQGYARTYLLKKIDESEFEWISSISDSDGVKFEEQLYV